jgi:hypothetical protein
MEPPMPKMTRATVWLVLLRKGAAKLLTNHKVLEIWGKAIPDGTNNDESGSNDNTPLAAPVSANPSCREAKDDTRKEYTGSDEAKARSMGTIKVFVPLREGLEAGEKRLVI